MDNLLNEIASILNVSKEWLIENSPMLMEQLQVYWVTNMVGFSLMVLSAVSGAALFLTILGFMDYSIDWKWLIVTGGFTLLSIGGVTVAYIIQIYHAPFVRLFLMLR